MEKACGDEKLAISEGFSHEGHDVSSYSGEAEGKRAASY
jgi:hypothetical protein